MPQPPLVAITTDLIERNGRETSAASRAYADAVRRCGGVPILIGPAPGGESHAHDCARAFDAYVLTGGDDPRTEPFGEPTDPRVTPMHADRQTFETALLRALEVERPDAPVLGICLGMQMMALVAGGSLDQYMPDTCPTHRDHWERAHAVRSFDESVVPSGEVMSKHKQAVRDGGACAVVAVAADGVIEAVVTRERRLYVGVQWHPERMSSSGTGDALFRSLVRATETRAPDRARKGPQCDRPLAEH